jgi:hypothetical protein
VETMVDTLIIVTTTRGMALTRLRLFKLQVLAQEIAAVPVLVALLATVVLVIHHVSGMSNISKCSVP